MSKQQINMELMLQKKKVVLDTLEWAIWNGDREVAELYDKKLKAILKEIKTLSK